MIESFLTLDTEFGPFEIKEKGSRFLSYAFPVGDALEAESVVQALWKKYYDATHICYGYRFGEGVETGFRYNDNGEPSGTAGLPIYQEIVRSDIFNILVVSIRYFGGVKLGTGGLTRTYGASAREALQNVVPVTVELKEELRLSTEFDFLGTVMYIVNTVSGTEIKAQDYTASGVDFTFRIPVAAVERFKLLLKEKSNGRYML